MRKKQLNSEMQMQVNETYLSKNPRQNHKKYYITKEDLLSISNMKTKV